MTDHQFGPFGITTGLDSSAESIAAARAAEELGYPAIWLSGGPLPGLQTITDLVGATTAISTTVPSRPSAARSPARMQP